MPSVGEQRGATAVAGATGGVTETAAARGCRGAGREARCHGARSGHVHAANGWPTGLPPASRWPSTLSAQHAACTPRFVSRAARAGRDVTRAALRKRKNLFTVSYVSISFCESCVMRFCRIF